jgi:putative membrane protein
MYHNYYGHPMEQGFGFGGVLSGLVTVGLIVLLAILIGRVVRGGHIPAGHQALPGSASDVLKTRYAKGEITKDEFESMKKDIA